MSKTAKLAALRQRTDNDLLILIERELDRGIALANVASARSSPMCRQAEAAYDQARILLQKISGLCPNDSMRVAAKLKELRQALDRVSGSTGADRKPAPLVRAVV